jgi:hypothetical protein
LLEAKYGSPEREQRMGREREPNYQSRRPVTGLGQGKEPKSSGDRIGSRKRGSKIQIEPLATKPIHAN